jgi:hypothetical protein
MYKTPPPQHLFFLLALRLWVKYLWRMATGFGQNGLFPGLRFNILCPVNGH